MSATADFDVSDFNASGDSKGVYAKFYVLPVEDAARSAAEGRPIFRDEVMIEILAAGNSTNIVRRRIREADKSRFREAYAKFQAGAEDQLDGTLLSEVPWITRSQVEELAYKKVRTLEQLATLSDSACAGAAGLYSLKQKAAAWMQKSEAAAPFTELARQNEELQARLASLEATIAASQKSGKAQSAKAE
jgi:hypothetical protein